MSFKREIMKIDWARLFCYLGLHDWYYGDFQTGEMSEWTGDHVGVRGRSCLDCPKKQKREKNKYITVKSFKKDT